MTFAEPAAHSDHGRANCQISLDANWAILLDAKIHYAIRATVDIRYPCLF